MGALKILEKSVIQANPLIRARKEVNTPTPKGGGL